MRLTNVPDLSARQLLAIVAIADAGSFIGASAFLKVSLPTLSRTVKRVERLVGVTLFERTTRRVEITPAGREFVAIAERLLNDLQLSLANMRDVATEQRGQVILSTFSEFAHGTLPPILQQYRSSRPQIELQVRQGAASEILEDVSNGLSDFGISCFDAATLPETIGMVRLWRESLSVIVPADHPLAVWPKRSIPLAQLRRITLISPPREMLSRRYLDAAAASAGFALNHAVTVATSLDILNLVSAGAGVGVVPSSIVSAQHRFTVKAFPLSKPSLSLTVALITLKTRHITPATSSLIQLIVEGVASQRSPGRKMIQRAYRPRPEPEMQAVRERRAANMR